MRVVNLCFAAFVLIAVTSCATVPYSPPALPKTMTWNNVSKRDLYAATLRAVHTSMERIDPSGTNEDGNLIRTYGSTWTWNDSMSVQTQITYSFSFLVSESSPDNIDLIVNYHTTWWNNGWGDWSSTISQHMHSKVVPAINAIVASLESQVGQPAEQTQTYLQLGGKYAQAQ